MSADLIEEDLLARAQQGELCVALTAQDSGILVGVIAL
jgi:hypothetical protein